MLTNSDTADIINSCKFYLQDIEHPSYIRSFQQDPRFTYSLKKRCLELRRKRSFYNPVRRGLVANGSFNYRTNKPRGHNSVQVYEPFDGDRDSCCLIVVLIVILAAVMATK